MELYILLFGLGAITIIYALKNIIESFEAFLAQRAFENAKRFILEETGDEKLTRLMIRWREDNSTYRGKEKLNEITRDYPQLCVTAFRAAIYSRNEGFEDIGIKGILSLQSTDHIPLLIDVHESIYRLRFATIEALLSLAPLTSVKGENSFNEIIDLLNKTEKIADSEKVRYIEKLLPIIAAKRKEFSYEELRSTYTRYITLAEELAQSDDIYTRHLGEDFRKTVLASIAKQRDEEQRGERNEQRRINYINDHFEQSAVEERKKKHHRLTTIPPLHQSPISNY